MHVLLVIAALGTATVPAGDGPQIEAGVWAALPAALGTGQIIGPTIAARYVDAPLQVGLRAQLGAAKEGDLSWRVEHTELRAAATAALVDTIGAGQIAVGLGIGGLVLREVRTRNEAARLVSAAEGERAWIGGALVSLDLSARLFVHAGLAVVVEAGPDLALVSGGEPRFGWAGSLAVAWSFGGGR